jgi:tellurite resistance protein TerC
MLVVMVAIGVTDVLFALDSIPAIFGLTKEPFLVVSANAFALMGLRQLYFLVGGLLDRLVHLGRGLAVVLGFIAVKLVLEALHDNELPFLNGGRPVDWVPQIPVWASLLFVVGTLAVTAVTSLISERRRADDGAVRTAPATAVGAVPGRPWAPAALGTAWPMHHHHPADGASPRHTSRTPPAERPHAPQHHPHHRP